MRAGWDGGPPLAIGDELAQFGAGRACGEIDRIGDARGDRRITGEAAIGADLELGDRYSAAWGLARDVVEQTAGDSKVRQMPAAQRPGAHLCPAGQMRGEKDAARLDPGAGASAVGAAMP